MSSAPPSDLQDVRTEDAIWNDPGLLEVQSPVRKTRKPRIWPRLGQQSNGGKSQNAASLISPEKR